MGERIRIGTKDFIFRNTFGDIEKLMQMMKENNTKPEFELYDVGHLYNLNFLVRRNIINFPFGYSLSPAFWAVSGPMWMRLST